MASSGGGSATGGGAPDAGNLAVSISVTPKTGLIGVTKTLRFTADVSGTTDQAVTWRVLEGATGGTVAADGTYTAPAQPGTYHVVATAHADATKSDQATVTVAPPSTVTLTPGIWKDISPPGLHRPRGGVPPFGCMDIHVHPTDPSTLFLTTDSEGMWKSTNAGASWARLGDLPDPVSPGVMAIDPLNPQHMYYGGGVRGASLGFWVSTNGGAHWEQPAAFLAQANNSVGGWTNDVYDVKADPADFDHVLITFHSPFEFSPNGAGVLETKNGGGQFKRIWPSHGWGTGHSIWFLGRSDTWLLGTQSAGYWRTSDSGDHWAQVSTVEMQHGGTSMYASKTLPPVLYVGAVGGILRSTDNAQTFTKVGPQTNDGYYAVIGDGQRMYTQAANTGANSINMNTSFQVSNENDGITWAAYNTQGFSDGPYRMDYDAVNGIIYASMWNEGVWALKVLP